MQYWDSGIVLQGLLVAALLLGAEVLRSVIPPLARLGIPGSILAGTAGLILGPSLLGVVPIQPELLEAAVYHGLAIVFIAVGLQPAPPREPGVSNRAGAVSIAFAVPFLASLQGLVGLLGVLGLGLFATEVVHPGVGLMLPLGFSQGPGQALSLGAAWEQGAGMVDGPQIGLSVAALGFGWAVVVGIPLVAVGRWLGWVEPVAPRGDDPAEAPSALPILPAGALELLTRQVAVIGVLYLATYGIVAALASALAALPEVAQMIWGFHFLIGAVLAMGVRFALDRTLGPAAVLDAPLLRRTAGLTVDFITCAALAAVQIAVLTANIVPIAIITTIGGLATLVAVVWFSKRAFPREAFQHGVLMFGMATGTLPTGMALLRILDPELEGRAPRNAVLGSAGALVLAAPVLLVVLPLPIRAFRMGWYPLGGWIALGLIVAYTLALVVAWRVVGPLRFTDLGRLWPRS